MGAKGAALVSRLFLFEKRLTLDGDLSGPFGERRSGGGTPHSGMFFSVLKVGTGERYLGSLICSHLLFVFYMHDISAKERNSHSKN